MTVESKVESLFRNIKAFIYISIYSCFITYKTTNASVADEPWIDYQKISRPVILFVDGHRSHVTSEVLSIFKYALVLTIGTCIYYVTAVLFGAPVFESGVATLYFSCFMVLLTVYPLCWHYCFSDNGIHGIIQIFSESECETAIENYFQLTVKCCAIGAWIGAFFIPLDWDRPWQIWPTTCCIGAALGYAASHFFIGVITLWTSYKEKKQCSWKFV